MAPVATERFLKLLQVFRGRKKLLVQTHNNPDPDAIGSAVGLRYLFQRYTGRPARIAFGGIVGRAENRAMLRYLKVRMIPGERVDYREFDLIAMVDTQPGFGYNPMPGDVVPQIVIDHHPPRAGSIPAAVEFAVLEEGYGASATIVGELLTQNRVPIPEEVATALVFGIKTETQDLGREACEADIAVYTHLYPLANKRLMSRIESERVPENYFREFAKAIGSAVVYDTVVVSHLGEMEVPDMVAEMADFLLRLEGARWTFVTGSVGETLYVSVRASDENLSAGEAIVVALSGLGSCGGHAAMAGGQVPLADASDEERTRKQELIADRFLDALKVKRTLRRSLVPSGEEKRNGSS
ncbi:MAG: DHH family phosphoesterase [Planctomycetes bacterium]|jgi:nanoRNase/pAp phosphatase (c-di-AMP/oligoRNAs hydrolase)|nr:DHH family phosphoesterase [Planctomycetota bacterium]